MCGVAGIYQFNGKPVSMPTLKNIGLCMQHRGPDNFGFAADEKVGMTHNRLSLLDLSESANQPFENAKYILSYNGEIYNFAEIKARLIKQYNLEFRTTSDTEVLFYSLACDGVAECLKQIKGMFAFAFYDRQKRELHLARDRFGIKPLYYYRTADSFFWASEVKAITNTLNLLPDPVRTLLSVNGIGEKSGEYTMFQGLRSVKPGSFLRLADGGEPLETVYYDILDDVDEHYYKNLDKQPSSAVLAEFQKLFVASVEQMLVSDAPMGAFVSGGLDSSLISVVAAKSYPNLKLFTANVVGKFSEYEDAEVLAKFLGSDLHQSKFEPQMMLRDWAEATYFYDCPIVVHANSIPFFNVAKLARQFKVKAVLTGEGSDELFLGYPKLLTRRYNNFASFPIDAIKSAYKLIPGLREYLFPAENDTPLKFVNRLIQNFETERETEKAAETFGFLKKSKQREQHLTLQMMKAHLLTILHRNDRMGMMASIEARFPFLDEDLVKFAVNLPSKYKIGRTVRFNNYKHPFLVDKWIVRQVAKNYLPERICIKKKFGFSMHGLKNVRINKGFFKNGWVVQALGLTDAARNFMLEKQDPYFVGKLASVEIFGQLFAYQKEISEITEHIMKFAEIIN